MSHVYLNLDALVSDFILFSSPVLSILLYFLLRLICFHKYCLLLLKPTWANLNQMLRIKLYLTSLTSKSLENERPSFRKFKTKVWLRAECCISRMTTGTPAGQRQQLKIEKSIWSVCFKYVLWILTKTKIIKYQMKKSLISFPIEIS